MELTFIYNVSAVLSNKSTGWCFNVAANIRQPAHDAAADKKTTAAVLALQVKEKNE